MNLEKLTNSDLLAYATILENIITTNISVQSEISKAVSGQFCSQEEIQKLYDKSVDAGQEADETYSKIQKELDLRVKRDLGMKYGITRSQSIIKELDAFSQRKSEDHRVAEEKLKADAERIAEETANNLQIVTDDNPE
jgi:predicted transcriptional regulator